MKRRSRRRVIGLLTMGLVLAGVAPANAAPTCIRVGTTCFATVQAAVNAAQDGDTVVIPAGQFPGGVVVTTSISLVGAGAASTALVGGEHVLTIGTWMAASEPTVSIRGLTLRGGVAHSSPESTDFAGTPGVFAGGGGLEIPAAADTYVGGTVTVTDSVITDNKATPVDTLLPVPGQEANWPHCPDGFCTFAGAVGGGVENWGNLTLVRTTVSNNTAGGPMASDSDGGGILSRGNLTLRSSTVTGNTASAVAPHGRYAEGGGIFMSYGTTLTVKNSSVSSNTASLASVFPFFLPDGSTIDMNANSGGIHVDDGSLAVIDGSHLDGNTAQADDANGEPGAGNAALQLTQSDLNLTNTTVNNNLTQAHVRTTADFGEEGSALSWCDLATIDGLQAIGNQTVTTAVDGQADSAGAIAPLATLCQGYDPGPSTVSNSLIKDNTSTSYATHGPANVYGAGLSIDSHLTMRDVLIKGNRGIGVGDGGLVEGGGIFNGEPPLPFTVPPSQLALVGVNVTGNSVSGNPTETLLGGGISTSDPITASSTHVKGNSPDQCFGCEGAFGTFAAATSATRVQSGRDHAVRTDPLVGHLVARR